MVLTIIRSLSYVSNNWPEMAVFYWNKRLFKSGNGVDLTHPRINGVNVENSDIGLNHLNVNPFATLSLLLISRFYKFQLFWWSIWFLCTSRVSFLGWIGILSEYTDCTQSVKWACCQFRTWPETKKDQSSRINNSKNQFNLGFTKCSLFWINAPL